MEPLYLDEFNITDLDGQNRVVLDNLYPSCFNIRDGWMYYTGPEYELGMFKVRADGSQKTQIGGESIGWCLQVSGDWLYFTLEDFGTGGGGPIVKMKTDESQKTVISKGKYENIIIDDGWIYYIDTSRKGEICKIKTDGSEKTGLGIAATNLNISGEWIYYTDKNDTVWRVKKDGNESAQLSQYRVDRLFIVGNWIYCYGWKKAALFRMPLDGSQTTVLMVICPTPDAKPPQSDNLSTN